MGNGGVRRLHDGVRDASTEGLARLGLSRPRRKAVDWPIAVGNAPSKETME